MTAETYESTLSMSF